MVRIARAQPGSSTTGRFQLAIDYVSGPGPRRERDQQNEGPRDKGHALMTGDWNQKHNKSVEQSPSDGASAAGVLSCSEDNVLLARLLSAHRRSSLHRCVARPVGLMRFPHASDVRVFRHNT